MAPNSVERLLTASQVADIFGVHVNTVYEWAEGNKLSHFRTPGGQLRFRREDVDAFIETTSKGVA